MMRSRMGRVPLVIGTRGLALLATFAMTITIARVLAPEASGAFFLVYTTVALAATLIVTLAGVGSAAVGA